MKTNIETLIEVCKINNRTGHTRTADCLIESAEKEVAALCAVAELAAVWQAGRCEWNFAADMKQALANLAAVRSQKY